MLLRFAASLVLLGFPLFADEVRLREESLTLPTYGVGEPDRNPRFYQGRTYQGARGQFYPYPVQDQLTGQREDRNGRPWFSRERAHRGLRPAGARRPDLHRASTRRTATTSSTAST